MKRTAIVVTIATVLLSASAAAQHGGHGSQPAPAKPDSATPAGHGAHGAHGASATGSSAEHMSGWKELDAYHMVMMGAWHPAKASGNLAPARAQASALASRADAWAASAVPAACDTPAARTSVRKVREGSRAFAQLVAAEAGDAETLAALRALHEEFEVVNRACKVR